MAVTTDVTNDPYIHAHGTTAEVLEHLKAQNVATGDIIQIWNATVGPCNVVYRR